ncbi:MAG: PrsW family intramembrane metalloprotease [Lachnospiraceae bacterium]|nr:PrsW family intramembrane metalloprotease [Lachnospiraceae bacterium]
MDKAVLCGVIPPILVLIYVYRMDKIEKEPIGLLAKFFIAGIIIAIPAAIVEGILDAVFQIAGLPYLLSVIGYAVVTNFIGVALVEEGFKFLVLELLAKKSKEFDYRFDAIVYTMCVGIAFAAFENILYIISFGAGWDIAFARLLPGHSIFAVFMGFYYGNWKGYYDAGNMEPAKKNKWKALLIPVLLHGFYDFCCTMGGYSGIFVLIFFAFLIGVTIFAFRFVNKASREDLPV